MFKILVENYYKSFISIFNDKFIHNSNLIDHQEHDDELNQSIEVSTKKLKIISIFQDTSLPVMVKNFINHSLHQRFV